MSSIIMDDMTYSTKQKKRILVVDDHVGITNLWRVMLEKTGDYIVREENHSSRAVETARAFRPDLLLLDISMPEIDGPEVARMVGSDDEIGDTAIVFLSSLVSAREAAAGMRVDGHRCLPKPTCVVELVRTIEDTIALAC